MKLANTPQIDRIISLLEYILPLDLIYKDVLKQEYYDNLTEEQITYFQDLKAYYFRLLLGFDIILQGKPLAKTFKELIDEELSDLVINYIEYWVDFYLLLILGWDEVRPMFNNIYLAVDENVIKLDINKNYGENNLYLAVKTPLDGFILILTSRARYNFSQCLVFDSRLYTQTLYRDYKNWQKIKRKKITLEPLSVQEEKTIKRAKNRFKNNELKHLTIDHSLQDYCIQAWSKSNNKIIKRKLKQYLIIAEELDNEIIKSLHPRNNPQPVGWLNGRKIG